MARYAFALANFWGLPGEAEPLTLDYQQVVAERGCEEGLDENLKGDVYAGRSAATSLARSPHVC